MGQTRLEIDPISLFQGQIPILFLMETNGYLGPTPLSRQLENRYVPFWDAVKYQDI